MKILVPLDLSSTSNKAIQPAVEIARSLGDEVFLVTVAGVRLTFDLGEAAAAEHTNVPEMIESYLKSTAAEIDGVAVERRVLAGDDAAESLVQLLSSDDSIRMIVIATHGRSGVERWRLGSVTERVVRHSEVPVLVVPARKKK